MSRPSSSARAGASSEDENDDDQLPLPKEFKHIGDILEEKVRIGSVINVCGIVRDFRVPIPTQKIDWKAMITLYDISTEQHTSGIEFSIFRPHDNIPTVDAGDVVLLYQVKVQSWNSLSLITNHRTVIKVYKSSKIPKYPKSASVALRPRAGKELEKKQTEEEHRYVSYFYHKVDKGYVPEQEEFVLMTARSTNVKEKFCLLQDIQESKFADLIVQACRDPYEEGDRVTLYVSDYTENEAFFNYTPDGVEDLDSGRGDEYGYTKDGNNDRPKKWVGPYGKKTLQVTIWEPHASIVREDVKAGDWVSLKNVQIKIGHNGQHLEGAMREERNLPNTQKVNVAVYDFDEDDKEAIPQRLRDAIRRWKDYAKANKHARPSKASKQQRKSEGSDTEDRPAKAAGVKRKAPADDTDETSKLNSKARRKKERAEKAKQVEEQETRYKEKVLGLNKHVICEVPPNQAYVPISSILEQQYYEATIQKAKMRLLLPFLNANYCANVRVVDFHPKQLEDFSRPAQAKANKRKAYAMLSDNSGDSSAPDSDDDESEDDRRSSRWEWSFALLLEDASPKAEEPKRLWAVVNNIEAQLLTNLDAVNLREDEETLQKLRDTMFTLWGTLEERKHWELAQEAENRKRKPGAAPPPTQSDEEEDGGGNRRLSKAQQKIAPPVSNKPFACCIRQYGVMEREDDPKLCDAGRNKRWQRTFGLFGTKISS